MRVVIVCTGGAEDPVATEDPGGAHAEEHPGESPWDPVSDEEGDAAARSSWDPAPPAATARFAGARWTAAWGESRDASARAGVDPATT